MVRYKDSLYLFLGVLKVNMCNVSERFASDTFKDFVLNTLIKRTLGRFSASYKNMI